MAIWVLNISLFTGSNSREIDANTVEGKASVKEALATIVQLVYKEENSKKSEVYL